MAVALRVLHALIVILNGGIIALGIVANLVASTLGTSGGGN